MPEALPTTGRDLRRQPTHPGAVLGEDVLPALDLSVTAAAAALGVSRQALHGVLSGKAAISPGMALRLAKLCGGKPDIWLNMQQAHDLWVAARAMADELERIPVMGSIGAA